MTTTTDLRFNLEFNPLMDLLDQFPLKTLFF